MIQPCTYFIYGEEEGIETLRVISYYYFKKALTMSNPLFYKYIYKMPAITPKMK